MEQIPTFVLPPVAIRVLIVDDHDGYRRMLRRLLTWEGLDVVGEAGDGCAGVIAARHWVPDLVLTDFHMPVMDGLQLARMLKDGPQPPPVILLTSEPGRLGDAELRAAGVAAMLEKGCDIATIAATARRLAAPRGALAAHVA
jgi:CheY-like chemotaxis protein